MHRRRALGVIGAVIAVTAASAIGIDLLSNKEPSTESQPITTATISKKSLPYVEIDTSLAENLDALYYMAADELVKSKGLLAHSSNKTFNDLVSIPDGLKSLKAYFDAVPTVRDGMLQLFTTLESQDKTYEKINIAINSINSAVEKLALPKPTQQSTSSDQQSTPGPFSQIFGNLNEQLKAVHDKLESEGSWETDSLEGSRASSITGVNYMNQGINFFELARNLFEDRAFIGQWEIKNITENKVYWNVTGSGRIYATETTALDWVGNSTQPIKSRERAFGRTVDVTYNVFNRILNVNVQADGKTLLDFVNMHPSNPITKYPIDISGSFSPTAIEQIVDLKTAIGSDPFDSAYLWIASRNDTYKFNAARLQMLLERCSSHAPSSDKLKYILKTGENQIGNILDFCKLGTFPDDVPLDYASVIDDLKFVDLIAQMIGYNASDYSTLDPTPSYNPKTDALFNLRQLVAKIPYTRDVPQFAGVGIQQYMDNFKEIYSIMNQTHTTHDFNKALLYLQIMSDKIVDFSKLQGSTFRHLYTNYGWDNYVDYFVHMEKDGILFSSTVKRNPVTEPKNDFIEGVGLNDFKSNTTFYGYAGILNESFPIPYNILLNGQMSKYAPEWLTSYLTTP